MDELQRALRAAGLISDDADDTNNDEREDHEESEDNDEVDTNAVENDTDSDLHSVSVGDDDIPVERVVETHVVHDTTNIPHTPVAPEVAVEKKTRKPRATKPKAEKPPKPPKAPKEKKPKVEKVAKVKATIAADDQTLIAELPKKVKEKAICLISGGRQSVYTRAGIDIIKSGTPLTTKTLVDHFCDGKADGGKRYTIGTARSQAQQVVSLLKKFSVVDDSGNRNTANARFNNIFS